jgi:hypothetical protein
VGDLELVLAAAVVAGVFGLWALFWIMYAAARWLDRVMGWRR